MLSLILNLACRLPEDKAYVLWVIGEEPVVVTLCGSACCGGFWTPLFCYPHSVPMALEGCILYFTECQSVSSLTQAAFASPDPCCSSFYLPAQLQWGHTLLPARYSGGHAGNVVKVSQGLKNCKFSMLFCEEFLAIIYSLKSYLAWTKLTKNASINIYLQHLSQAVWLQIIIRCLGKES